MIIIPKDNIKQTRLDGNLTYKHEHSFKIVINNSMRIEKCSCGLILGVRQL